MDPDTVTFELDHEAAAVLRHVLWNALYDVSAPDMAAPLHERARRILERLPAVPLRAEWFASSSAAG